MQIITHPDANVIYCDPTDELHCFFLKIVMIWCENSNFAK